MKRSLTATVVGIPVGLALLTSPLISCGCLEPWQEILGIMGAENPHLTTNLNATALDAAAKRKYLGKPTKSLLDNTNSSPSECLKNEAFVFDCTFWVTKGLVRETGFRVTATSGPEDEVKTIEVVPISRYFRSWRP